MERIRMAYMDRLYKEIQKDIEPKVMEFLKSGKYILGDYVKDFEIAMKERYSFIHCAGVASGTDALMIALRACNVLPGDEVILPAFTIFIDAAVVKMIGAIPVFVEVNEEDFNINPKAAQAAVTEKTKAILSVHLFGQSADMSGLREISKKYNLPLIEDACQALGAQYKGIYAGNLGDIGCFSFYPTKNLGAMGDGGFITARDPELFKTIKLLHLHGVKSKPYVQDVWAYNSRLDAFQALILNTKLKYLEKWEKKRRQISSYYNDRLKTNPKLKLPVEKKDCHHVYHQYTLQTDERQTLQSYLEKNNIETAVFYPTIIPQQPAYLPDLNKQKNKTWPVSEKLAKNVISIPINPQLTDGEIDYIINRLLEY